MLKMKKILTILTFLCIFVLLTANLYAQKTIRIGVPSYGDHTEASFKKMAADYEKANPNVKVKIENASWASWRQKIATDFIAGASPDVIYFTMAWLPGYVAEDLIQPLDAYLTPALRSQFPSPLIGRVNFNGGIWALPSVTSARVMYVNLDLFKKAGAKIPETWDELKEAARKITQKTDAYGFGLQGKEVEMEKYFFYVLWNFGGDLLNKDIGATKSALNSPAAIKAAMFYESMIKEGLTQPNVTAYNREDLQELFKQGKLAMVITHKLLADEIRTQNHDVNYAMVDLPGVRKGSKGKTLGVIDVVSLTKNSKVKKEAFDFLVHTLKPEYQADWIAKAGLLPVTIEAGKEAVFQDEAFQALIRAVPNAKFSPLTEIYSKLADILIRELQNLYSGKKNAESAMNSASRAINRELKRANRK